MQKPKGGKFNWANFRRQLTPILVRNLFSPTVALILFLSIVLFSIKQSGDALFLLSTMSINALVGIVQEIRAKLALDKLEIVNAVTVRRFTGSGIRTVNLEDITPGDLAVLRSGDQVAIDGIVTQNDAVQIDESMLTGESKPIDKKVEEMIYAGSIVVAGSATVRVVAVGDQTKAAQMTEKLKWYDQKLTPLQESLNQLIRYFTYVALFVSVIIYLKQHGSNIPLVDTLNTIVAGALSLVPEGLILASSLLFSYGAVVMAYKMVLVQRLAAIEGFGRLNYLCLDKTGTLTEPIPAVEHIIPAGGTSRSLLNEFLLALVKADANPNATLQAISICVPNKEVVIHDNIPFSSDRKYSALQYGSLKRNIALGGPDILRDKMLASPSDLETINKYLSKGLRVLAVVDFGSSHANLHQCIESKQIKGHLAGIVILSQKLRPGAIDTLFYLQAQGVKIKVISGDNAQTVQYIAKQAGIRESDKMLTGDELAVMDNKSWKEAVPKTTLFARVLPEQKEKIIKVLRKHGYTGMVGDGVNDALALKAADLSACMLEGSGASRQIADVVLLSNSFEAFPIGMRVGSRIILGLEMVTCLFMNKMFFSLVLITGGIILNTHYPFQARHLLLLNLFTVGMPTFLWSIVPPETSHRLNPKHFFRRTLRFAIPNGIITGIAILVGFIMARWQSYGFSGISNINLGTFLNKILGFGQAIDPVYAPRLVATFIAFGIGLYTFLLIPRALGAVQSRLQKNIQIVYLLTCPLVLLYLLRQNWFQSFFHVTKLNIWQCLTVGVVVYLGVRAQQIIINRARFHAPV